MKTKDSAYFGDTGNVEHELEQQQIQHDVDAIKAAQAGGAQDGSRLQEVVDEQQYLKQPHSKMSPQNQQASNSDVAGSVLQSGDHCARISARLLPDGTYEAQVFLRLTREPALAETYVPAGIFPTEAQARQGAEQRARRALEQHEF